MARLQAEAHVVYVAFFFCILTSSLLLPSPLLLFGSWPIPAQAVPTGHSLVPAPVALVSIGRAVSDHTALVPHGLRQRGAHQTAAANLGPVLLRGLPGVVPDDAGHVAP